MGLDILIVTDGMSHALDVHRLAASGRRVSALLVGEDSLDANVGHLAALTGGDLFVGMGAELGAVLGAALQRLREPGGSLPSEDGAPELIRVMRGNALLEVEWREEGGGPEDAPKDALVSRAVAAFASSLRLVTLSETEAAALASAEGLVTHLTSLVLVDDEGEVHKGVPASRKTPLPRPRVARPKGTPAPDLIVNCMRDFTGESAADTTGAPPAASLERFRHFEMKVFRKLMHPASRKLRSFLKEDQTEQPPAPEESGGSDAAHVWRRLVEAGGQVDWEASPSSLLAGDLSTLPQRLSKDMLRLAGEGDIRKAGDRLGLDPLLLIIGIVARGNALRSRSAARLADAIIGRVDPALLQEALDALGVAPG